HLVSCDLTASPTDMGRWRTLGHGQPITVSARYAKNGVLIACELLPLNAPAEAKYKGKEIEIRGLARATLVADPERFFPTVILEPETNSRIDVDCVFRKTDADEISKIQPGAPLTIAGTCSGRSRVADRFRVRIDNCQLVYTSAPAGSAP